MTRVGVITWTSKGFTLAAAAPSARAPARRPGTPRRGPESVARTRRPRRTTTKELSRR
jgi:hypothetical protein